MSKTDRSIPEVKYTNLYMKNLDADVSEDLLREKFSEFGKIVSLAIAKDENGSCKGFGFVNFDNPEDARRAAETMNGSQFGLMDLFVFLDNITSLSLANLFNPLFPLDRFKESVCRKGTEEGRTGATA